jgi:hypothetical protein
MKFRGAVSLNWQAKAGDRDRAFAGYHQGRNGLRRRLDVFAASLGSALSARGNGLETGATRHSLY